MWWMAWKVLWGYEIIVRLFLCPPAWPQLMWSIMVGLAFTSLTISPLQTRPFQICLVPECWPDPECFSHNVMAWKVLWCYEIILRLLSTLLINWQRPVYQWLLLLPHQITPILPPQVGPSDLDCPEMLANFWVNLAQVDGMEGVVMLWYYCETILHSYNKSCK